MHLDHLASQTIEDMIPQEELEEMRKMMEAYEKNSKDKNASASAIKAEENKN